MLSKVKCPCEVKGGREGGRDGGREGGREKGRNRLKMGNAMDEIRRIGAQSPCITHFGFRFFVWTWFLFPDTLPHFPLELCLLLCVLSPCTS